MFWFDKSVKFDSLTVNGSPTSHTSSQYCLDQSFDPVFGWGWQGVPPRDAQYYYFENNIIFAFSNDIIPLSWSFEHLILASLTYMSKPARKL